ncbi:type VII secretion integral membrane protein EccD [Actinocatenispora comari]|uniref:Type VII secretion integral membrane protein EccD n=1 Tax=Actinocatenispora comari TaxID=2807577 RepID=A0A8J4AI05_9ACTN|nr:type VII secretion integral membrane protein EccD [Actinocatenispora comari]GIL31651.1 type VII secretion integral membrane protein EccD [Actinocatenispora comari]
MTVATGAGLTRVTVVAPKTRVDLSIPDDLPLADLLPTLLRYVGEDVARAGVVHGGWALARLGGAPFATDRTPAQLAIKHGEELHFTPREQLAPEVVFDDVVDAIAAGVDGHSRRWSPTTTRRFGLGVLAGAVLLGAALLALAAPPIPGGVAGLAVAALLLVTATVLARAVGDARAGLLAAALAAGYGFAGGLLLLAPAPGRYGAGSLLLGAMVTLLCLVLGAIAVAYQVPAFVGAALAVFALCLAAFPVLAFGVPATAAASVLAAVALGALPVLPMSAFRLARLPVPTIPMTVDELKTDAVEVAGADVLARTVTAGHYLTALLAAAAAVLVGCVPVLVAGGGWAGPVLTFVASIVLLCRCRVFPVLAQRLPLLLAGLLGLAVLLAGVVLVGSFGPVELSAGLRVTVAVAALLVIGAAGGGYGLAAAGRRATPVGGRVLDIVEVVLGLSVVPLVLAVCGLYTIIRALNG